MGRWPEGPEGLTRTRKAAAGGGLSLVLSSVGMPHDFDSAFRCPTHQLLVLAEADEPRPGDVQRKEVERLGRAPVDGGEQSVGISLAASLVRNIDREAVQLQIAVSGFAVGLRSEEHTSELQSPM